MIDIRHGDSREELKTLADCSVDAVVCDPPYALVSIGKRFGAENAAPAKEGKTGAYARASAGFMGQKWDTGETAFAVEFWREVFRVLKPGGYVIAFGGTRTYHRLACAIEDAGFEIRDMISWLYGSGFPKSHDVSKGIARRRVEDVEPVRTICRVVRAAMDAKGLKSKHLTKHFADCNARLIDHWAARDTDSQPLIPTPEQWEKLVDVLDLRGLPGFGPVAAEFARLTERKGTHGDRWLEAEILGEVTRAAPGFGDQRFDGDRTIRSLDDESAQWAGWGTALKPACEPCVLARKPIEGTVAANVLKWGTGALNIDGCRVGDVGGTKGADAGPSNGILGDGLNGKFGTPVDGLGRWPANVIHDGSDEVVEAFPTDAPAGGNIKSSAPSDKTDSIFGAFTGRFDNTSRGDEGSAARFFYTAKADATDRLGSSHPTVKPTDLMMYMLRLVTPPGGTVLDPFAGSGSTGVAAVFEGFDAILIEREEKYVADIRRRIAWAQGNGRLTQDEVKQAKPKPRTGSQVSLLDD